MLLPLPKPEPSAGGAPQSAGVVEWKLPHIDWNPWTCCSGYQQSGPYQELEPEARSTQISKALYQEMSERKLTDHALVKVGVGVWLGEMSGHTLIEVGLGCG